MLFLVGCVQKTDKINIASITQESSSKITNTVSDSETADTARATENTINTDNRLSADKFNTEVFSKTSTSKKTNVTTSKVYSIITGTLAHPIEAVTKDFDEYNNKEHFNNYITTEYSESEIVRDYIFVENLDDMSKGHVVSYDYINSKYPIECVRKNNENIYVLYKTKEGGLFYVFFNQNLNIKYTAYATRKLSYNDFIGLKSGDSITEAEKIEPAISFIKANFITPNPPKDNFYYITNHILTDGALRIIYKKNPQNDDYLIHQILYSKDFIIDTDDFHSDCLNFKVLESDYIS